MKKTFLFITYFFSASVSFSQNSASSTFLQAGFTVNFLYQVDKNEPSPLGGGSSYSADNLKPLPGFAAGIMRHQQIASGPTFFRFGVVADYKVSGADMNYHAYNGTISSTDKKNIKTRFRNLYIVLPAEFGASLGKAKTFYVFGGANFGVRVLNESTWKYYYTQYTYDYSTHPTDTTIVGPTEEEVKPSTFSSMIALELGAGKMLAANLSLEVRCNAGLNLMCEIGNIEKVACKQVTAEILLGWRFNKSE